MQENNKTEQVAVQAPSDGDKTLLEQPLSPDITPDNQDAVTSFGKFKSAESLFEGYQQLEKEFTKKCQVLKKLEGRADNNQQILEKMLQINPDLSCFADELKNACGVEEFAIKLAETLTGKIHEPCNMINDEEFLNNYVYSNEKIINKIVADYLDSLVSIQVPQTIAKGGNCYVSPTYRPRTLDEAGKMAKKFIENRRF